MYDPIFPKFKTLEISDKESIETHTKNYPPYSDFDFSSLWAYNTSDLTELTWLNQNLVIKHADYISGQPMLSFIGNNKPEETVLTLMNFLREKSLPEELSVIPEDSIKSLLGQSNLNFIITEDLDQNDYIIPLKESSEALNINPHKLKALEKFRLSYPSHNLIAIDLQDQKIQAEIFYLFDYWASKRKRSNEDSYIERNALKRMFEISQLINISAFGLFINNKIIGYIIDEYLQSPYVIGHFIKADTEYPGVYEFLNQETARVHYAKGYKYINIEQDLGIEGLRISKMQRSPSFFLKKYKISKKPS